MSTTLTTIDEEFILLLKSKVEDDTTRDTVLTTFQDVFEQSDVQNGTLEDIRQLKSVVDEIDKDFQKIGMNLYEFDSNSECNEDIPKLKPKWDGYRFEFTDIMEQSRRSAVNAAACLNQYTNAMLDDVTKDKIPDVVSELENLKKSLRPHEKEAFRTQEDFKRLSENIRLFNVDIDNALKKAESYVSDDILEETRDRLNDLQEKLEVINSRMCEVGRACLSCLADVATSVGVALFTLSPVALSAIADSIDSGTSYMQATEEAQEIQASIQDCKSELEELVEQKEALERCKQTLQGTKHEIFALSDKIIVISNVWKAIKVDIQTVEAELNIILGDGEVTSLFLKKVQASRKVFQTLNACLVEYAAAK